MKRVLLVFLVGIFIVGIVSGASETQSDFIIAGCDLGTTGLLEGSCSPDGNYFCNYENSKYKLYDTVYDPKGCSYGVNSYTKGQPFCCPIGYVCENNVEGPICNLREEECSEQLTKSSCENIGCFWLLLDEGGICTDRPTDYSCEVYQTSETCLEDKFGLGQTGIGTEICGTYFIVDTTGYVIPFDTCQCEWNDNFCVLGYNVLEQIHGGSGNSFRCIKSFNIGECINGLQLIKWNVTPQITEGYLSGIIPPLILEASGCIDNPTGTERNCGTPIVKLFGFSLLSVFISLGIVGLFYFFRELRD